jgi:hypothetical protein
MMKNIIATLCLAFCVNSSWAQEYVVSEDIAIDSTIEKRGPNRKHYRHSYMNFGACIDAGETGGRVRQPRIDHFTFGVRYKRRLAEHFAIGYDINYTVNDFALKQESSKKIINNFINKRERMIFNIFEGGLFARINVGKRGNQLGKFIDLGGYGSVTVAHTHFTLNRLADGSNVRTRTNGLNYFQRFNYGLNARLGMNKIALFGQYRLSDMFYANWDFPELPRIMAGIEFNLR